MKHGEPLSWLETHTHFSPHTQSMHAYTHAYKHTHTQAHTHTHMHAQDMRQVAVIQISELGRKDWEEIETDRERETDWLNFNYTRIKRKRQTERERKTERQRDPPALILPTWCWTLRMLQISDHWTRGSATHSNMLNTTPTLLTADPDMGQFKGAFSTLYSLLTCKQVTNLYTEHPLGHFHLHTFSSPANRSQTQTMNSLKRHFQFHVFSSPANRSPNSTLNSLKEHFQLSIFVSFAFKPELLGDSNPLLQCGRRSKHKSCKSDRSAAGIYELFRFVATLLVCPWQ